MPRIAYLGPPGTFSEEALLTQRDLDAERVPVASIPEVIAAVEHGDADLGVVPIENSIEGPVTVTLDHLAFESELLIQREIDLPIRLNLCARPGVAIADVARVLSHPHAHAQCRDWMRSKLPDARIETVNSTAEAARLTARSRRRDQAAVGTAFAAELYRLDVLAAGIEDHADNMTRFVLVGDGIPAPTGHDKTSIVCFQRHDRPGSLLAILQEFAARAVNLTKLESRPTKRSLGDYCFFIDFEGHLADEVVADCLRSLAGKQARVKFLGSYPVAGEEEARARRRAASRAGRQATAWVDDLRRRVRQPGEPFDTSGRPAPSTGPDPSAPPIPSTAPVRELP